MNNLWIGLTDEKWFNIVSSVPAIDEVNFWQPGGGAKGFGVLKTGEPFLFKLHSPNNYIVGGGFFLKHTILPLSLAWEAFEEKNGARTFEEMRTMIIRHRKNTRENREDFKIGCVLLVQPFFFERSNWLPVPEDWHPNIQQGKRYQMDAEPGKSLWGRVRLRLSVTGGYVEPKQKIEDDKPHYGDAINIKPRLGQGAFRIMVTDAYKRACAITLEHSLPALEAAHIKPFSEKGDHEVCNGLLLRSDFHRLFDKGYITVTPEYIVEVSRRLKDEYENGHSYYPFHGKNLNRLPEKPEDYPDKRLLAWHNENIFVG